MDYLNRILLYIFSILLFSCSDAHSSKTETIKLKEIHASKIIKELNGKKSFTLVNAIIYDDLDLTTLENIAISGQTEAMVEIPQQIYFQDCVFMGRVTACENVGPKSKAKKHVRFGGNVNFVSCDFRKEINFNEVTVMGDLSFSKTVFNGKATFNHILVNGRNAVFSEITAYQDFQFIFSTVRGDINFIDATFQGNANFSTSSFNDFIFNNVKCQGRMELSDASVKGVLKINYATCEKEVSLGFSKFHGSVSVIQSTFEESFDMERSIFYDQVKLNESTFNKEIITKDALFYFLPETQEMILKSESPVHVNVVGNSTTTLQL